MQFSSIFLTLLAATAVAAKGHNGTTKAVTDKSLCKQMAKLQDTVDLAANTTKLDAKLKNNATKIADFEAKASAAATTLQTMQSNTTLVSTCAVIAAANKVADTCDNMKEIEKNMALAANTTKLDSKFKGNATKIAEFQAKVSAQATKLDTLNSNATLTSACSAISASAAAKKAAKASATSSSSTASSTAKSGAAIIDAKTGGVLSLVVMAVAGTLML
ncbi:hypothetical protein BP6252_02549 [Coleophoma cylindrospora]|uniref:Cell wall protein n=1 Tax=Coleophoma cylindrospora TaxID=1849047 RepID=A0A3D8SF51_9HELO|nr:hypothetical protein BP6252_02549 [Coleophoma cylindrospora]